MTHARHELSTRFECARSQILGRSRRTRAHFRGGLAGFIVITFLGVLHSPRGFRKSTQRRSHGGAFRRSHDRPRGCVAVLSVQAQEKNSNDRPGAVRGCRNSRCAELFPAGSQARTTGTFTAQFGVSTHLRRSFLHPAVSLFDCRFRRAVLPESSALPELCGGASDGRRP